MNRKYERDADLYNQEASFDAKDGKLPDFVRPRHAFKGSSDQQIMTIINNFPVYFPRLARRRADDTNDKTTQSIVSAATILEKMESGNPGYLR